MATTPSPLAPTPTPVPAPESGPPLSQPAAEPQTPTNYSARQDIYQKYYGEPQQPAQQPVATEPTAQVVPDAQDPAAPAADAPDPQQDRISQLEGQFAQVVQILERMVQPQQQPVPGAPAAPAGPSPTWVELVRQGKIEDAEQALFNKFESRLKTEVTSETLEAVRVEGEVKDFLTDLRGKNPDLVQFEEFIGSKAEGRLKAELASGRIRDTAAYVDAYKRSVNAAVADARNLVQQIRAAGKNDALTVRTEVLSSSPVAPNAVDQNRGVLPTAAKPAAPQSPQDYIARRQADAARRAGLLTT